MALVTTLEEDNFVRFGQGVIGTGTRMTQDLLASYISPSDLTTKILPGHPVWRFLKKEQRILVGNAHIEGYNKFDISLTYTLLRNVCVYLRNPSKTDLPNPTGGWNKYPKSGDETTSDDLERIHFLRNNIYGHASHASMTEPEYKKHWQELRDVAKRLGKLLNSNYDAELQDLEIYKFTDTQVKSIIKEVRDNQESRSVQTKKIQDLDKEVQKHDKEIQDHGKHIGDHDKQIKDQQIEIGYHGRQIEDHGKQIEDHDKQFESHEKQFEVNSKQIEDHGMQIEDHDRQIAGHGKHIEDHDTKIEDHDKQMQHHSRQIHVHNKDIDDIKFQHLAVRRGSRFLKFMARILPRCISFNGEIPDIRNLRHSLITMNERKTKIIPLVPLEERGERELPIELLYSSVVIREDTKYARKGPETVIYSELGSHNFFSEENPMRNDTVMTNNSMSVNEEPKYKIILNYKSSSEKNMTSISAQPVDSFSPKMRLVKDPDDIFIIDGEEVKNIYMLGDAAHGKTTYCIWLLKKWCNAKTINKSSNKELDIWEKALQKFDFVFLLQFRYINPKRANVVEMICQDIFGGEQSSNAAVRYILTSDEYKSLIIMDGLDEWNPDQEAEKQLACKAIPNIEVSKMVTCFISMRPWLFQKVSGLVGISDRVVEIQGLSETGMENVIEKVLSNHYKLGRYSPQYQKIYNKVVENLKDESLKSFMQIPLLAVVCVQIWYEDKQVGDSMTSFYTVMVDMLIERAVAKHRLEYTKKEECQIPKLLTEHFNIRNWISVLLKIGLVAYEGLLSNQTNLVFQKRKLEEDLGKENLQFALDVGLISQKEAPSIVTKNVEVHFFHKSIQEFLAAVHIVTRREAIKCFCQHLTNVNIIMDLSNVITFICGMSSGLSSVITKHVNRVIDCNADFKEFRESLMVVRSSRVESMYKIQTKWYREFLFAKTMTSSNETFYASDVCLWSIGDSLETIRLTRKLLNEQHAEIKSLYLLGVPTSGDRGVSNEELNGFLQSSYKTRSLVMLQIKGERSKSDRFLPSICAPKLETLCLEKVRIQDNYSNGVPVLSGTPLLKQLKLHAINLCDHGLPLTDMLNLKKLIVDKVDTTAAGWQNLQLSLQRLQTQCVVKLTEPNIHE